MSGWRMIDHDGLRSLAVAISENPWSWHPDEVPGLCRRLGWELLEVIDGKGAFADAGWNLGDDDEIEISHPRGYVQEITMQITEHVREEGIPRARFMHYAYTQAIAVVTEVLGEPTARQRTEPPTTHWRLADSTVLIRNLYVGLTLTWASNRFQNDWDKITEALA